MKLACIVTAAGQGKRFGSDKLAFPIEGVPMGVALLKKLQPLPFAYKALVTSPDKAYLIKAGRENGYGIVLNDAPGEGLSRSVRLGMTAIEREGTFEGVLCAVADQPKLREGTLLRLLAAFSKEPDCIWALSAGGKRGNPVLFPWKYAKELLEATGDRGGRAVIEAHREALRLLEAEPDELMDLDTKEEAYAACAKGKHH